MYTVNALRKFQYASYIQRMPPINMGVDILNNNLYLVGVY